MTNERIASLATGLLFAQWLVATWIPPNRYHLPLKESAGFTANFGQVIDNLGTLRPDVKFYSEGGYPQLFMCKDSWMTFAMAELDTSLSTPDTTRSLRMHPIGPLSRERDPVQLMVKDLIQNFYFPWTGSEGVTHVPSYYRVVYEEIYPYIDMHFFAAGTGQRIAFVIRPGGDPADLLLAFEGQDEITTDTWGNIKFILDQEEIKLPQAQAYQVDTNDDVLPLPWSAIYDPENSTGTVSFNFGAYDDEIPLVLEIGPAPAGGEPYDEEGMCWSTYFGGNGNGRIRESATDPSGKHYVAGETTSSFVTFPSNAGVSIGSQAMSAFVCQLSELDRVNWKSFFGVEEGEFIYANGISFRDVGEDDFPSIYIAGQTTSPSLFTTDFQTAYSNPTSSGSGNKGYIARFGTSIADPGMLLWAAYVGDGELLVEGITRATNDKLYITGMTLDGVLPTEQEDAPNDAEHFTFGGHGDAFVIMFNEQDRIQWATTIGGTGQDWGTDIAFVKNPTPKIVVVGNTRSPTLQTMDGGGDYFYDENFGGEDVFLLEFTFDGDQRWGTFIGGPGDQSIPGNTLAVLEDVGDVVVVGHTAEQLPLVVPGPGWYDATAAWGAGFIARFSGTDRDCEWFTHVRSAQSGPFSITAACFDAIGNLFVAGETSTAGLDTRTVGDIYYSDVPQENHSDGVPVPGDMFLMSFTPSHWLPWWTYFGGDGSGYYGEQVYTMLRRNGNLYVAGASSKDENDWTAYFPLDQADDVPYFTDDVQGTLFTGMIAAVCADVLTGTGIVARPSSDLNAWVDGHGQLQLYGLPLGPQDLALFDLSGRVHWQGRVTGQGGPQSVALSNDLSAGVYLLRVAGIGGFRIVVN